MPGAIPDSLYGSWKEYKTRGVLQVYKKRIPLGQVPAELYRSVFPVKCDAARVVGVLSNPRHFQHSHESFTETKVIHHAHPFLVHTTTFNIQKNFRSIMVFQTKSDDGEGTIIAMRSIASFTDAKEEFVAKDVTPVIPDAEVILKPVDAKESEVDGISSNSTALEVVEGSSN
jgi:hypothetical protein